jgi:hypothetical protein
MTDRPRRKIPLYCSVDVEYDGPNPLQHNMKSLGVAAFVENVGLIDTLYLKLNPQVDAANLEFAQDPATMLNFWREHEKEWAEVTRNTISPQAAMGIFAAWIAKYSDRYILKWNAKPANCDWMWVRCYYDRYGPSNKPPLHWFCFCLSTALLTYCLTHGIRNRSQFARSLSGGAPYTHNAKDDAVCVGYIYMNLRVLINNDRLASTEQC